MILKYLIVPYTTEKNYYRNYRLLRLLLILLHRVINYRDASSYLCIVIVAFKIQYAGTLKEIIYIIHTEMY